ncbi:hypothetical protein C6A77_08925 [Pseudomonas sp. AFG_SD02_1510_Pfu_092]|nr:hypothetical protein C6A77_08925 [Pseudomonas sp. AFG_SD02_1510_Pfu_092]
MGAGKPAKQAARCMTPASPVFAAKAAPTGTAWAQGLREIPVGAALAANRPAQPREWPDLNLQSTRVNQPASIRPAHPGCAGNRRRCR